MVSGPFIWLLLTEPLDQKGAEFLTDSHFWNDLSKSKTLQARIQPKLQDIDFLDWDRRVIIGFKLRTIQNPFPSIFALAGKRLIWTESNRGDAKPKLKNRQWLFINVCIYLFISNMFGGCSDLFSWLIFCPAAQSLGLASRKCFKNSLSSL